MKPTCTTMLVAFTAALAGCSGSEGGPTATAQPDAAGDASSIADTAVPDSGAVTFDAAGDPDDGAPAIDMAAPDASPTDDATPSDTGPPDMPTDPVRDPVVLVHGYLGQPSNWDPLVEDLVARGWSRDRIFAIGLSNTNDSVPSLGAELAAYVAGVLASTGASRVDVIGHSLGAPVTRWWLTQLGGLGSVHDVITVAGSNHGTNGACALALVSDASRDLCPAWASESQSDVQFALNGAPDAHDVDETPGEVAEGGIARYLAVALDGDLVVTPYQSSCLNAVRNDCSDAVNRVVDWPGTEHISMIRDDRFFDLVAQRLLEP